jgi:hypothetical protein
MYIGLSYKDEFKLVNTLSSYLLYNIMKHIFPLDLNCFEEILPGSEKFSLPFILSYFFVKQETQFKP